MCSELPEAMSVQLAASCGSLSKPHVALCPPAATPGAASIVRARLTYCAGPNLVLTSVQQCESVLYNHTHGASETVTRHIDQSPASTRCGRAYTQTHTHTHSNSIIWKYFKRKRTVFFSFPKLKFSIQTLAKFPLVVEIFSTTAVLTFEKEILFVVHW